MMSLVSLSKFPSKLLGTRLGIPNFVAATNLVAGEEQFAIFKLLEEAVGCKYLLRWGVLDHETGNL